MKKILSLLSTISLFTITTTNIIACQQINKNNENNKSNKPIEPQFIPQQPPKNSNWKLINNYQSEFSKQNNKWYILIFANKFILKEKYNENDKIKLFEFKSVESGITKGIKFGDARYVTLDNLSLYRWDGDNEPTLPTINNNTGEITDWNEKIKSQ